MCGLVGFLSTEIRGVEARGILRAMTDAVKRRGPDDVGMWLDDDVGIALGHRRLAIVDLSPAGHQPMISGSGRFVIAYNGEIYNHVSIRNELQSTNSNQNWRGHSDTETLLSAFETWGVSEALRKCVGMFAFALWDREHRQLTLGRDRLGEKPLYYGWQGEGRRRTFLFGSELKALREHPDFRFDVDRQALTALMRFGYIPSPLSAISGIKKLEPGTTVTISTSDQKSRHEIYWSFMEHAKNGLANPLSSGFEENLAGLEGRIKDAISLEMEADVPVGAFLSGGIDSSTVVALMQEVARERGSGPVRTFTIGFQVKGYDEAPYAKAVAQHLGTNHTEHYVNPRDAIDVVAELATMYSEPFADSSQIPTFLVSKLARQYVTVSLSGDAGDELFGGYNRYVYGNLAIQKLEQLPRVLRQGIANIINSTSVDALAQVVDALAPLTPKTLRVAHSSQKISKFAQIVGAEDAYAIYRGLVSTWSDCHSLVIGATEPKVKNWTLEGGPGAQSAILNMMATDTVTFLPDDILCKVDRAAMHVSLETRVPLLDHRVVEYAWRMPFTQKIRAGAGKWPLRNILYKRVPRELIERPKMGFGVPLAEWLRGPLRGWTLDLLSNLRLQREGYFNADTVGRVVKEHMSGRRDWSAHLWHILMFQAWLDDNSAAMTPKAPREPAHV
ncbi:MAG: asparagine synthase (glutamine-hydrolyzing) [Terriglobia bacterium]|nr:asparagine synthase (glutamine-hydrolyzing) [Terriglobia bacterium]